MFILMIGSTDTQKTAEKIINITSSSLTRGHQVVIFFNSESTKLLKKGRIKPFSFLISQGVRFLACRTSALEMDLYSQGELITGSEMSNMGELVELIEVSERVLFLG